MHLAAVGIKAVDDLTDRSAEQALTFTRLCYAVRCSVSCANSFHVKKKQKNHHIICWGHLSILQFLN